MKPALWPVRSAWGNSLPFMTTTGSPLMERWKDGSPTIPRNGLENQTLTFTEADKVSMSNTFIRAYDEGFEGSFGVSVANGDNQWSRAFIQFQEGSASAYSTDEDALMYGDGSTGDVFLWTEAEAGEKLSIQSLVTSERDPSD